MPAREALVGPPLSPRIRARYQNDSAGTGVNVVRHTAFSCAAEYNRVSASARVSNPSPFGDPCDSTAGTGRSAALGTLTVTLSGPRMPCPLGQVLAISQRCVNFCLLFAAAF